MEEGKKRKEEKKVGGKIRRRKRKRDVNNNEKERRKRKKGKEGKEMEEKITCRCGGIPATRETSEARHRPSPWQLAGANSL